jgi:para-nitrobenzyl esterase
LNIWTPDPEASGLPVLVWIHGGAFANGSGAVPVYEGSKFARDGVVCVTINYRLGVDGFLFMGDGVGNLGILDQIAALQWVKENISAFGGDPDNVTIAGESAGGMSVTTLLSLPQTKNLFRRVIAESGAGHHVLSPATAQKVGQYLAEKLGVDATREAIAAVPVERVLQAQVELSGDAFANPDPVKWGEVAANLMPFEPVVDSTIIPARPIDSIMAGVGSEVEVLIGSNTEEERLFMVPNKAIEFISADILNASIAGYGLPLEETLATYRENRPNATPGELMEAVLTDWFFRIPASRVAEARSKEGSAATYVYEFAWRSPAYDGQLGACHALEIGFAFDTLNEEGNLPLTGPNPPQQLADTMHATWVGFIKNGNPGWPQYDLEKRATMRFDLNSEVVNDPRAAERKLWDGKR